MTDLLKSPSALLVAGLGLFALTSCTGEAPPAETVEPTFLYVELLDGESGSIDEPLAFTSIEELRTVRVTALDRNGDPVDFAGDLELDVRPGSLTGRPWVTVEGGTWEGTIGIRNGFGPTRIWFSDVGDRDSQSKRPASYATGVSDEIYYSLPTLGEMSRIDDHETNQLAGEFAEVRTVDREVRVSAVGAAGYWVTDIADEAGSYNSLFVYTFSRPDPSVQLGRRLSLLTGANQEYLATTQFSFPHYEVSEDDAVEMPEPALITRTMCDNDVLEGFESSVVRLEDVGIPTSFTPGSEAYTDYLEYGQWPIDLGENACDFYVNAGTSIPDYRPQAGQRFTHVEGLLSEVWGRWVVLPRNTEDLSATAGGPPGPTNSLRHPVPQPRPDRNQEL